MRRLRRVEMPTDYSAGNALHILCRYPNTTKISPVRFVAPLKLVVIAYHLSVTEGGEKVNILLNCVPIKPDTDKQKIIILMKVLRLPVVISCKPILYKR